MLHLLQLTNLLGDQLQCRIYSDVLKIMEIYLKLFYTAENGAFAMREYKEPSNEHARKWVQEIHSEVDGNTKDLLENVKAINRLL